MNDNSAQQYAITFHPEKCIQCHGCEAACKVWRNLPPGIRYRRVMNLWQGEYPELTNKAISLACLHCVEPACVAVCPVEALSSQPETGLILVENALCTGCRLCFRACPYGVPQFGEDKLMQKCDLCNGQIAEGAVPPCVDTCPSEALIVEKLNQKERQDHEDEMRKVLEESSTSGPGF